jgi:hypothetical protein
VNAFAGSAADFADPPFGFDQRHQVAGQLGVLQRVADALFAHLVDSFVGEAAR